MKPGSGAQLVQQRLGILEICSVEALGEPVVDIGVHRARLVALKPASRATAREW
jgi:hypothetical protein